MNPFLTTSCSYSQPAALTTSVGLSEQSRTKKQQCTNDKKYDYEGIRPVRKVDKIVTFSITHK